MFGRIRNEALCVAAIGLPLFWAGCSVEKNYELLSFFFDGVPNPNALPIMASSGDRVAMRSSPTYTAHTPYLNGQCAECHGQGFTMGGVDAGVCLTCHEGVQSAYRHMHGPVAFGACLLCHVPHESAHAALLKSDSRAVCTQCHGEAMLSIDKAPEHKDETVSCLACHYGHGDSERFMLRDTPLIEAGGSRGGASPGMEG
ncbi:MAG: hypothetical protein K8E66_01885 [Phycisphaerales bacterium]|nr:hypothetical protein [Phycisphaerales bacterium]